MKSEPEQATSAPREYPDCIRERARLNKRYRLKRRKPLTFETNDKASPGGTDSASADETEPFAAFSQAPAPTLSRAGLEPLSHRDIAPV